MKLSNSPLTVKFLKRAKEEFSEIGLFWGCLTLFSGCFTVTNDKWLILKVGSSGCGKTISDTVAIEVFGKRHCPLTITGRFTPAGVAKLMKRAQKDEFVKAQLEEFKLAKLIFVEDLSRCTTRYLKLTSLQFLAGLTRSTSMDDLTSEGGTLGESLGEEPKKAIVSFTPTDWDEVSSSAVYNEFIDRRSLTGIALMSPKEWQIRESLARNRSENVPDWNIILKWKTMIADCEVATYTGPIASVSYGQDRISLYDKIMKFKKFPENVFGMIDSLAEGHARINSRDKVLEEDYEAVNKLFSRFIVLSDMKKKELYLVEELIRSHGILEVSEVIYKLRKRSKKEDYPELSLVERSIYNYTSMSKYLDRTRACKSKPSYVLLSDVLRKLFNEWDKEVQELIN